MVFVFHVLLHNCTVGWVDFAIYAFASCLRFLKVQKREKQYLFCCSKTNEKFPFKGPYFQKFPGGKFLTNEE